MCVCVCVSVCECVCVCVCVCVRACVHPSKLDSSNRTGGWGVGAVCVINFAPSRTHSDHTAETGSPLLLDAAKQQGERVVNRGQNDGGGLSV